MSSFYLNAEQSKWLEDQALEDEKGVDVLRRLVDGLMVQQEPEESVQPPVPETTDEEQPPPLALPYWMRQ